MKDADYYAVAAQLLNEQQDTTWRRLARHVMPALLSAGDLQEAGDDGLPKEVCSHAATAVLKLASAHSMLITPMSEHWFSYEAKPPGREATDNEKNWCAKATEVAHNELRKSNFYAVNIAATIDRIFGTGVMLAENNKKGRLVFRHVALGTFGGEEDEDSHVDTVARRFKFTAHQAAQRFGVEVLDEQMKAAYEDPKQRYKTKFELWHLCIPRDVAPAGNSDNLTAGTQMGWASVYISPRSQKVMLEEGYEEFPYLFTRFLKVGPRVMGKSPLEDVESVIKKYLELEESVNELAKKAAFPAVLTTADMTPEELDLRAGGVTILKDKALASGLPREWASSGRINEALMEKEDKKKEIDDALFITQLQSVSSQERPMTATEVLQRKNEQLRTFSSSFTQFMADFRPMTERIFCLLYRAGKLPAGAPEWLFKKVGGKDNAYEILSPEVEYHGILAKALEEGKQENLMESLQVAMQMFQATGNAEWQDYYKPYECLRFMARSNNVPVECFRTQEEAEAVRQQREQVVAAQQQAEVNLKQAQAAAALNKEG